VTAEKYFKEAIELGERSLGEQHPRVAHDLKAYAIMLRHMNSDTEAAQLEARASRIERNYPSNAQLTVLP